jgi:hypothetical protein
VPKEPSNLEWEGTRVNRRNRELLFSSLRVAVDQAKNLVGPAGEVIEKPPEGLERLKLVTRLLAVPPDFAEISLGDVNSARRQLN